MIRAHRIGFCFDVLGPGPAPPEISFQAVREIYRGKFHIRKDIPAAADVRNTLRNDKVASGTCVFDQYGNLKEGTGFANASTTTAQTGDDTTPEGSICMCPDCTAARDLKVSYAYDQITISGPNNFEIRMTVNQEELKKNSPSTTADADGTEEYTIDSFSLDLTGMGSMTLQIGANENQTLELRMPPITMKNLGISRTDVLTEESAGKAIEEISKAITFVSSIRSSLGAYQNRLEHTTTNLEVTSENMTSAYSRIMDVDMATEMTRYSSLQVISQAATSMLAQANERPSQVLQLLQ